MSAYNWRIGQGRGASIVRADTSIQQHPTDPDKRIIARNVKRSLPNHYYESVRVYYCRERRDGRWINVSPGTYHATAEEWFGAPVNR